MLKHSFHIVDFAPIYPGLTTTGSLDAPGLFFFQKYNLQPELYSSDGPPTMLRLTLVFDTEIAFLGVSLAIPMQHRLVPV